MPALEAWAGQRRFVVLDTAFGLGHRFLGTWAAWRADPARCAQLCFIALAAPAPTREALLQAHRASALEAQASELAAAWPPLTRNLHLLDFEGGAVRLLLGLGEPRRLLPQLWAGVHAFHIDSSADRRLIASLARLALPNARLQATSPDASHSAPALRADLLAAGFQAAQSASGTTFAHYAPHFTPRRSPGRVAPAASERKAIVIGAGIAGACAAASLARLGWQCTVLERLATPASGASGNPAALFHGTAHAADGVHARLHRAAALHASTRYAALIASGAVAGSASGLRRVQPGAVSPGLPNDYVELQDAGATAFYPGAGWVEPASLVRALLAQAGITLQTGADACRIEPQGARWSVFGRAGQRLAQAPVLVLTGGLANGTLVQTLGLPVWPEQASRGQVSWFDSPHRLPCPVTGHGYAVSLPGDVLLCGATAQEDDADVSVRAEDHAHNLARLQALTGLVPAPAAVLHGRTGWRAQTPDRLPIVGAVPLAPLAPPVPQAPLRGQRLDQPRLVPRVPGLFVLGGLGSRGFTWGPLAGEVLAAWIDGAPMPLEAELLDAIDPARWAVRAARAAR